MAKKGTKAYRDETTHIVYGISRTTKKVRMVFVHRDGVLSSMAADGTSVRHPIKPGWTAEREAGLVFGLSDTFIVPVGLTDGAFTQSRLAELKEKAEKMAGEEPPAES